LRTAVRRLKDGGVDAEPAQGGMEFRVERGDREPVDEVEGTRLSAAGRDLQPVVDEVEVDLEAESAGRVHAAGRQAPHVEVRAARATSD
jgi:hypothetical protein